MQNVWVWVVAIVIIVGGGLWWWSAQAPAITDNGAATTVDTGAASLAPTPTPDSMGSSPTPTPTPSPTATAPTTATVTYDGNSFSPSTATIKKGGTVTFKGTSNMWVASAPHPTHEGYSGTTRSQHCPDTSGTAFDECAPGAWYIFTFQKVGTWGYHDHMNASSFGKVIVVE